MVGILFWKISLVRIPVPFTALTKVTKSVEKWHSGNKYEYERETLFVVVDLSRTPSGNWISIRDPTFIVKTFTFWAIRFQWCEWCEVANSWVLNAQNICLESRVSSFFSFLPEHFTPDSSNETLLFCMCKITLYFFTQDIFKAQLGEISRKEFWNF